MAVIYRLLDRLMHWGISLLITLKLTKETQRQPLLQVGRYLVVGVVSVVVDVGSFQLLNRYAGLGSFTSSATQQALLANTGAQLFAVAVNYYLSRTWVFTPGRYSQRVEIFYFLLAAALGYSIQQLVLYTAIAGFSVAELPAKLTAVVISTAFNFISKKYFVFQR